MIQVNGSRMREKRLALGLSQTQAAERAGLRNYQHWQRIEGGGQTMVDAGTLWRVARALKLKMESLLVEVPEGTTAPTGAETEGSDDRADVVRAD